MNIAAENVIIAA